MTSECRIRLLLNHDAEPEHVKVWLTSAPQGAGDLSDKRWDHPSELMIQVAHEGVSDDVRPMLLAHSFEQQKILCLLRYHDLTNHFKSWMSGWGTDTLGFYISPQIEETPERWLAELLEVSPETLSEIYILCGQHDPTELLNWVRRAAAPYEKVFIEH
ncbi:MAG: hypothetical protein AB8C84_04170 [Oligoflexales bacterium]